MTRVALALSPHLDDAAFSCGGLLSMLAVRGWRVVVATMFTRSVPDPQGFALACQLDKGLGPEVDYMALRRAEDTRATTALGAEPRWLDLPEAPHRGYESAPALFEPPREDDDIVAPLARALRHLADELRPDIILAPQAIGAHVDHVQAVRSLAAAGLTPALWWTDFPYTIRDATPKRPFAREMTALAKARCTLDSTAVGAKRASCLAYASQLGFQFGGVSELDARLDATGGVERFRVAGELPPDVPIAIGAP